MKWKFFGARSDAVRTSPPIVPCSPPQSPTPPFVLGNLRRDAGNPAVLALAAGGDPDLAVLGLVNDTARFANPQTKRFPPYLIDEVTRLITSSTQQLRTFELVSAVPPAASSSWQACAPAGSSGAHVEVHYDLQTRPGVAVAVSPADAHGCVNVQSTTSAAYSTSDVSLRTCVMPWSYINAIAGQALATSVDTRKVIKKSVPQQYWPLVDRDPLTGCADALSGPTVSVQPTGQLAASDAGQPFGLYGIITIRRS
jgi:hypothetical protein